MDLLSQMATFVRIVDAGSLSAAARIQRLSLPAISRQLQSLEEQLGVSLLLRTTRHLQMTEAGRTWYAYCVRILRELEEAKRNVNQGAWGGTLTVSVPVTIGMKCIVPKLLHMMQQSTSLSLELRLEDKSIDLIAEGVDVAVRAGLPIPDSSALISRPLLQFKRIVVASPGYLKKHSLKSIEELSSRECLLQVSENQVLNRWRLYQKGESKEVEVFGRFRATAPLALHEAALSGLGVAFLPEWLVQGDIAEGRLRRVLPSWEGSPVTIWALYRTELRDAPKVKAFVEAMR